MPEKPVLRHWTFAIAQLRQRAGKLRTTTVAPHVVELIDESLTLSDAVVRELAGTSLQFDEYRGRLNTSEALWIHLFEALPVACVETDVSGIILDANRSAGALLNISAKHLVTRLLIHFTAEREEFGELIREIAAGQPPRSLVLTIRPRERASIRAEATVIARVPGETASWLWFFLPVEKRAGQTAQREQPAAALSVTTTALSN